MSNLITIGQKPAEEAPVAQEQLQAPPDGVLVTPPAVEQIRAAMAKENLSPAESGLRLGVKGGGCSGMSYAMKFEPGPRDADRIFEFDGVRVFIDPKSFVYLRGITLDYEKTLIRQGFIFSNPNAARSCGCGTSFSV